MKYFATDLNSTVKDLDGNAVQVSNREGTAMVEITVKEAFRRALGAVFPDEQPSQANPSAGLSFEKKMERYEIAKKIVNCETAVDLETKEQSILKDCVNKLYPSPEMIGYLNGIIERKSEGALFAVE